MSEVIAYCTVDGCYGSQVMGSQFCFSHHTQFEDERAQLRTERDALAAEVERLRGTAWAARCECLRQSLTQAEAERDLARARVAELEAALRKYGRHTEDCEAVRTIIIGNVEYHDGAACTCGLDVALATPGDGQEGEP